MIGVSIVGLLANLVALKFLHPSHHNQINVRAAYLHVLSDLAGSVGAIFSGVVILVTGWKAVDPAITLLIALGMLWSSWGLLRDSANLALHAVPADIDPLEVRTFLLGLPGVEGLHDLHIWAMSTTETALTAHLVMPQNAGDDAFLAETSCSLHDRFGIERV